MSVAVRKSSGAGNSFTNLRNSMFPAASIKYTSTMTSSSPAATVVARPSNWANNDWVSWGAGGGGLGGGGAWGGGGRGGGGGRRRAGGGEGGGGGGGAVGVRGGGVACLGGG